MKITTIEVAGLMPAIRAMRNPYDSWGKSDSSWVLKGTNVPHEASHLVFDYKIGSADRELSTKLAKAGPEHCKHLRMIMVWADITAPRYWWTEADTYRAGVEKVSCSTMHRLTARDLTADDFEEDPDAVGNGWMSKVIDALNGYLKNYRLCREKGDTDEAKRWWRALVRQLPQSYLQKRTVMFSYAALRNIYRQRRGHRLAEWKVFLDWVESLPESWMITDGLKTETEAKP